MSVEVVEYIDARGFLAHAAQAVFDSGFVPAHTGRRWPPPTWTQAATALDLGRPLSRRAVRRANEVLQWVKDELGAKDDPDDFERRLVELLSQERLTRRELPTAAAAVYSYHQHLHRVIAARAAAASSDPADRR